jgi:hypothetical protein
MAKYALIDNTKVHHVIVADTEEAIGVMAQLFDIVDVTHLVPQPAQGWSVENGVFYPPMTAEAKKLWNGTGFDDANIIDAEVIDAEVIEETPEIEAPAKGKKASK